MQGQLERGTVVRGAGERALGLERWPAQATADARSSGAGGPGAGAGRAAAGGTAARVQGPERGTGVA
jgi:hypothetical protein